MGFQAAIQAVLPGAEWSDSYSGRVGLCEDGQPLQVEEVDEPSFRLARIEVARTDAIDMIKFVYDDDTTWVSGRGQPDSEPPAIMTPGEYVVKVVHERFASRKVAAAAVTFWTNKNRKFEFLPRLASKQKSETTTVEALPGNEIIALTIRRGVLRGSQQQPAPPADPDHPSPGDRGEWYAIATCSPAKTEDPVVLMEEGHSSGLSSPGVAAIRYFTSLDEALRRWKRANNGISGKTGGAATLFNCMTLEEVQSAGTPEGVRECRDAAAQAGIFKRPGGEYEGVISGLGKLFQLLANNRADHKRLFVTTALLFFSFYFELEARLVTGHLMTIPSKLGGEEQGEEMSKYTVMGCRLVDCSTKNGEAFALVTVFVILCVLERIFYVANVYIHHLACAYKNVEVASITFKHLVGLDQTFFDTHTESEIRAGCRTHVVNNLLTWNIPYLITIVIQIFMVASYLLMLDIRLGGAAVGAMIALRFGFLQPMEKSQRSYGKITQKIERLRESVIDEALRMMTTIKYFSTERNHVTEHDSESQRTFRSIKRVVVLRCIKEFVVDLSRTLVFAGVMLLSLESANSKRMSVEEVVGFFLLLRNFFELFNRVKWHWEELVRDFPDIDRFLKLHESKPVTVDGHCKLGELEGRVDFRDVRFGYPSRPGQDVVNGLNLRIQPKKMTAIVGDSGAGKSTITKLLMRLYDPREGQILIDGVNIRDIELQSLHSQVAIVSQTPELFDASLGDNIAYGDDAPDRAQRIQQAADLANCGFVKRFRAGFDTFPGAGGSQVSGGERQRIAIARAAMRNPKLLILDEATSALDAANEAEVKVALDRLMVGRTTIVIAHRLSTVKNADEIICMQKGKVVEKGTHDELMAANGAYADLVKHQLVGEQN